MGKKEIKESLRGDDAPLEHDPSWAGVKVENRSFNDLFFLVLFVINLIAVCAVSWWSYGAGDPSSTNVACPDPNKADDYFGHAIIYLKTHSYLLGVASALAFGFGLVWLVLLRLFTKIAIYVTLAAAVAVVIGGGVFLVKSENADVRIGGYVLFGVAAVLVLIIIALHKKIALTAAVMAEACKALQHNPATIFVGFLVLGFIGAFLAMWIASLVYMNCIPSSADPKATRYAFLYLVFGGMWIVLYLIACLHCSIAGGVAVWYFSRGTNYVHEHVPMSPTLTALGWAFSSAAGSLAFGSLILAVIAFIRFLLYRAQKAAEGNKIASCILGCLRCCCACIFGIVQALNDFAYIYVAMYGTSFVESAKKVFNLIGRNPLQTVMVDSLTNVLLWFGRIIGTVLAVITVGAILQKDGALSAESSGVMSLAAVLAFIILSVFANIISCAVDTVYVCYCEDMERNQESGRYLMDADLHAQLQEAARAKQLSDNKQAKI